jgi:hypothetical protein
MTRAARLAGAKHGTSLAALLLLVGGAGCAHHTGKSAAQGFAASVRESQANVPPEQQIARVASTRAVEGALQALDQPPERARLQKLVDAAVAEAVASALRVALTPGRVPGLEEEASGQRGAAALLAAQIGRAATEDALGRVAFQLGGEGALRQNIVATGASATDAAVGAALDGLFPECRGDDAAAAACRREHVQALTRATAAGFSAGVRDSLKWPALFLAAIVGLTIGALAHWALTLRRRRPHAFRPV